MVQTKRFYNSRTLWALFLHLLAAGFAYFGVDIQLGELADLPDGGVTVTEAFQFATVLAAGWYRWQAQHVLQV